jgi:6-phosphogluconolactonase (cycloisomerase 2 family)
MKNHLLFVQSNALAKNQIMVYNRAADGTLTLAETVDTGGAGGANEGTTSDTLTSQGSLAYDPHHGVLIAVNAGSNTVSVLGMYDGHLTVRQVLASGGTFPVSVTVHGDLLYVLNAHDKGAITGYRIVGGQFQPIKNSTRSLELTPATGPGQAANTPAQVSFTPDGQHLVITTKGNGSLIDVFAVEADGRPSGTFVANPASFPGPFGFTFDDQAHLVVTDVATNTLATYTIHPDGHVKSIASQPDGQLGQCWVTRAAGNFYVADNGNATVTGYHIDPAGTPTVFTQASTRQGPIDLTGTRDGHFLYVEVAGAGGVDGYRINPDGTLTQITTVAGPSSIQGIAVN